MYVTLFYVRFNLSFLQLTLFNVLQAFLPHSLQIKASSTQSGSFNHYFTAFPELFEVFKIMFFPS